MILVIQPVVLQLLTALIKRKIEIRQNNLRNKYYRSDKVQKRSVSWNEIVVCVPIKEFLATAHNTFLYLCRMCTNDGYSIMKYIVCSRKVYEAIKKTWAMVTWEIFWLVVKKRKEKKGKRKIGNKNRNKCVIG